VSYGNLLFVVGLINIEAEQSPVHFAYTGVELKLHDDADDQKTSGERESQKDEVECGVRCCATPSHIVCLRRLLNSELTRYARATDISILSLLRLVYKRLRCYRF